MGAEVAAPSLAVESGRICAVAGQTQRQMRGWAAAYPGLYSAKAFDPALYSTLALATAFSGPWLDAGQQRMANRVTLWCFGLDWLVDYVATTPGEARGIADRCTAVAGGAAPPEGDELTAFLAEIRDELAAAEGYGVLSGVWRDELRRMLAAMVRECEWKAGEAATPTFEEYLGNADNLGFSFVFAAHWTATEPTPADVPATRAASWAVQRVIRLLNDLATYERDVSWGDLNALMLGVDRAEVGERVTALAGAARHLIRPLRGEQPRVADYLERQMEFCMGFYGVTDYWGSL
jgi:Terpene synthase family 2, C-terminal metal binding